MIGYDPFLTDALSSAPSSHPAPRPTGDARLWSIPSLANQHVASRS